MDAMQTVLGAVQGVVKASTPAAALTKPSSSYLDKKTIYHSLLPMFAGAVAGGFLWKKHRVLGAIGGLTLGGAAYQIYKNEDRKAALVRVGIVGTGIAASLYWKKHPAIGYVGGALGAALLSVPLQKTL
jgi:hypothetical protein